jgi:hypothetical protein
MGQLLPSRTQYTYWCETTLLRASALLHRIKRMHIMHVVNKTIIGMFPIGCGLGDSRGAGIFIHKRFMQGAKDFANLQEVMVPL